jgi:ribosome-associated translation inhibitor RaiA
MTRNRVLFLIIITMTITASCLAFAENQYADDIAVIEAMTSAMGKFADKMEASDSKEDVIAATDALSDALDKIVQKMKAVTEKHPDWIDNPPAEVTDAMERHKVAMERFSSGLNELCRFTNDHADNQPLNDAYMRLNLIIFKMYQ